MSRIPNRAAAALLALGIQNLCGGACANASPIEVSFALDLPAMTALWPRGGKDIELEVERAIGEALRSMLQDEFQYWKFVSPGAVPPGQARISSGGPRILFRLHEETRNEALLRLEFHVEDHRPLILREVLWNPGNFAQAALFNPTRAKADIPALFWQKLVKREPHLEHYKDLERRLMDAIPLAEGGVLRKARKASASPAIVLPLPWDDVYKNLRASEFRLDCDRHDTVTQMFAVGTGHFDTYPFKTGRNVRQRPALVVTPYKLQEGPRSYEFPDAETLMPHTPRYVFLLQYRAPSALRLGQPPEQRP
ncbi:MAG TPA: hypothetical protein VNW71_10145 [Thermoanaerobaculia bacterium]|nr:hypothetical protein [Thermoanaerobaculia bacterium]